MNLNRLTKTQLIDRLTELEETLDTQRQQQLPLTILTGVITSIIIATLHSL